jgi:hypothetical protein
LEFREFLLDRESTTAIPISYTAIIPPVGITTSNPTIGTTEDRHTIRITGIECIPVTTVIICQKPRWAQSTETRGPGNAGLSLLKAILATNLKDMEAAADGDHHLP